MQWASYDHPDPHGLKLKTLQRILQRIRSGGFDHLSVETMSDALASGSLSRKSKSFNDLLGASHATKARRADKNSPWERFAGDDVLVWIE